MTRVTEKPNSSAPINKEVLYYYDHLNRLVKRVYDADGAGSGASTTQYWAYDDGINALVQYEGSTASTLSHRYLWTDQVDEILSDEQVSSLSTGGNPLYAMSDHLGSVRDIADLNEGTGVTAIANHRTFNAYGKLISETNSAVDLLFAFTGKQLDEATNLQHNLNRWYDSGLGQWLNEDPIGFTAKDSNLRRYVHNIPNLRIDQLGLEDPPSFNFLNYNFGGYGNGTGVFRFITGPTDEFEKIEVSVDFSQISGDAKVQHTITSTFMLADFKRTTVYESEFTVGENFQFRNTVNFEEGRPTSFESQLDARTSLNFDFLERPLDIGVSGHVEIQNGTSARGQLDVQYGATNMYIFADSAEHIGIGINYVRSN